MEYSDTSFISGEYSCILFALVTYAYKGSSYLTLFFSVFHEESLHLVRFSSPYSSRLGGVRSLLARLLHAGLP